MEATTHRGGPIDLAGRFRLAAGVRVVRRSADAVQIGGEPPRWRILHHAPLETAAVLNGLDGSTSLAEVLIGAQADVLVWQILLTELRDAGLLVLDGARGMLLRRRDAVVVIRGVGPLAGAVAELLSASAVGAIRSETGASELTGDRRSRRDRAAPEEPSPTLVVLAGATPPPEELAALVRARWPHIAVHATLTAAVLGPFVLPGLSTCLLCILRHRNDLDLGWPVVEAGLRTDPVEPPAALRALAAAAVTAEVLRAVDGLATPATLDATLEWRGDGLIPRRRSFSPHPECDCAAIGRRPDPASPPGCPVGRQ